MGTVIYSHLWAFVWDFPRPACKASAGTQPAKLKSAAIWHLEEHINCLAWGEGVPGDSELLHAPLPASPLPLLPS